MQRFFIDNAGDATSKGAELELRAQPSPGQLAPSGYVGESGAPRTFGVTLAIAL